MNNVSYKIAVKAMMYISAQGNISFLEDHGIMQEEWETLVQDRAWSKEQKSRCRTTLNQVIYGVMDEMNIPRIQLPAEMLAACIAVFIKPINGVTACCWMERTVSAIQLGMEEHDAVPCTASQLISLVIQLYRSTEHIQAISQFDVKTNRLITKYEEKESKQKKENKKESA